MNDLAKRHCVPCEGGVPALRGEAIMKLLRELGGGWEVVGGPHLRKQFRFPDFVEGLGFVNRVGGLAEEEGHHPDLQLSWGKVVVEIHTHKIDGLTVSDFILAARIDEL